MFSWQLSALIDNCSIFARPVMIHFHKGFLQTFPSVSKTNSNVGPLIFFYQCLQKLSLNHWNLLAMPSLHKSCLFNGHCGELGALMADQPYMVLHKDSITLRLHSKFILKAILDILLTQTINLPTFFLKLHTSN